MSTFFLQTSNNIVFIAKYEIIVNEPDVETDLLELKLSNLAIFVTEKQLSVLWSETYFSPSSLAFTVNVICPPPPPKKVGIHSHGFYF
jgi:hypothetical protein